MKLPNFFSLGERVPQIPDKSFINDRLNQHPPMGRATLHTKEDGTTTLSVPLGADALAIESALVLEAQTAHDQGDSARFGLLRGIVLAIRGRSEFNPAKYGPNTEPNRTPAPTAPVIIEGQALAATLNGLSRTLQGEAGDRINTGELVTNLYKQAHPEAHVPESDRTNFDESRAQNLHDLLGQLSKEITQSP